MKVVILAGGKGTRLAEETSTRPKPMVEIGGKPIIWYIMKHYSSHGFDEFVIALGFKGDHIKRYFAGVRRAVRGHESRSFAPRPGGPAFGTGRTMADRPRGNRR